MHSLAGALMQAVFAGCLAAGAACDVCAEDPPAASGGRVDAEDGGALFNPFADARTPQIQPPVQDLAPDADWSLPFAVATAGLAGIAVLIWKMTH